MPTEEEHEEHSQMLSELFAKTGMPKHGDLVDITSPEWVEIEIRHDGEVVWIHVDGITVVRICRPKHPVVLNDKRPRTGRKDIQQ